MPSTAPRRPAMHARDSSGRQVSLLNDEPSKPVFRQPIYEAGLENSRMVRSNSSTSSASSSSTPALLRSESYDSQSTGPMSPGTPLNQEFGRPSYTSNGSSSSSFSRRSESFFEPFPEKRSSMSAHRQALRPSVAGSRTTSFSSFDEEDLAMAADKSGASGKRYPCRFRDSHGCEKTFTTSGHASRHSKIHTAEKAVQCSHPGCEKKFTRADNMKQHLETHYKERSRSSTSSAAKAASKGLTMPAGVRKASVSGKSGRVGKSEAMALSPSSPSSPYCSMDMGEFQSALLSRPVPARTESSGLDALAMACQSRA